MYNDVSSELKEKIELACKELNSEMLLVSRWSLNESDAYMYVVLAKKVSEEFNENEKYIVWYYNDSLGGLNTGSYMLSFKDALEEMASRVK